MAPAPVVSPGPGQRDVGPEAASGSDAHRYSAPRGRSTIALFQPSIRSFVMRLPSCTRLLIAALLAALAFGAAAQTPPSLPTAPKHSCVKPPDYPGRVANENVLRTWTRQVNNYLGCLKAYIAETQAAAKPYQDAAKVYIDATNAAIEEFNTSAKQFTDQQEKGGAN
jgi:hypothetical protein